MRPASARRSAAGVVLLTAALATGGAASAATTPATPTNPATPLPGEIGIVEPAENGLRIGFSASSADPLVLDSATVHLQAVKTGAQADAEATATGAQGAQTVVLALDTSESMESDLPGGSGSLFKAEKVAAQTFVAGLPDGVKVGLLTFNSTVSRTLAPTRDHEKVRATIQDLKTSDDTALYRAVTAAARMLPDDEQGMVVMITDGDNDLGKDPTDPTVIAQEAKDRKQARKTLNSGVFFRGLIIGQEAADDLRKLAPTKVRDDGTGSAAAVAAALNTLFTESKQVLDRSTTLTVPDLDPQYLDGTVTVTVSMRTAGGQAVGATVTRTLAKPAPVTTSNIRGALPVFVETGSPITTPVLLGALGALFVAIAVLLAGVTGALSGGDARAAAMAERLSFYSVRGARPQRVLPGSGAGPGAGRPNGRLTDNKLTRGAVAVIDRLARQRQLDHALDARLEAAGLPIRTAEWMLLHVGSGVGFSLLLLLAAGGRWLGAVLGLVIGLAGPWLTLSLLTARRESRFLAQLPDTLQLLAGSLAAGYSLPQAMDAVLRESQAPISVEFNRALVETRLGMPPEDALEGIAERTGSRDFSWIVMAIRIQREVGGNLAELLATVAGTLRERERLRRQVSALSAEGRLSGIILGALPVVFALFLIFFKPLYIAPLLQTTLGWLMIGVGTVLLTVGGIWMSRVVKVEV